MTIGEMNKRLSEVDDISWGMYAFSRDVLCHRIGDEKKRDMIQKAVECGNQLAERTALRFGTTDPWQIARSLGLSITFPKEANVGGRILFALFTPPNQIQIMREPIQKAASDEQVRRLVTEDQMKNLILGHELFHFLEEEEEENKKKKKRRKRMKKILFSADAAEGAEVSTRLCCIISRRYGAATILTL